MRARCPDSGKGAVIDPVPEGVRDAALQAFDARVPGARTLDLVSDSTFDLSGEPTTERRLRFGGVAAGVEIVVRTSDGRRGLEIQVLPPRPCDVWLAVGHSAYLLHSDAAGLVTAAGVRPELVSVIVLPSAGVEIPLQTAWVRV